MYSHKEVENTLRNYRRIQARIELLEMLLRNDDRTFLSDYATNKVDLLSKENVEEELKCLKIEIRLIDAWLLMLTPAERFVIETHTIGGLDWARVLIEEEKQWGKL